MFENFSSGDLRLDLESDILKYMRSNLTWNSVKILLETEFNQKNKNADPDRAANKEKALSDINIKKRLNLNWKDCKKLFPIFDKCPNFALCRLKVIFVYSNMIDLNTLILNSYITFLCRITDYGMIMMKTYYPTCRGDE